MHVNGKPVPLSEHRAQLLAELANVTRERERIILALRATELMPQAACSPPRMVPA